MLALALIVLSFLSLLGGALLTSTTMDVRISQNYKSSAQALYLAETGIEAAHSRLPATSAFSETLSTGTFTVSITPLAADPANVMTVRSVADAGASRRSIEATFARLRIPINPTPRGLDSFATRTFAVAHNRFAAGSALGNIGSPSRCEITVVDGDAVFGPGTGYGFLVVRGALKLRGNFQWTGLILVNGTGGVTWEPNASGAIIGGISAPLASPPLTSVTSQDTIDAVTSSFPWLVTSFREY